MSILYFKCLPRDIKLELFLLCEYENRCVLRKIPVYTNLLNDCRTCKELYRREFSEVKIIGKKLILWANLYWEAVEKYYNKEHWIADGKQIRNEIIYKFKKSVSRGWEKKVDIFINPDNIMSINNAEVLDNALYKSIECHHNHITVRLIKFCYFGDHNRFKYRDVDRFGGLLYQLLGHAVRYNNFAVLKYVFDLIKQDNIIYSLISCVYGTSLVGNAIKSDRLEMLQYISQNLSQFNIKTLNTRELFYHGMAHYDPKNHLGLQNAKLVNYLIEEGVLFDNTHMLEFYAHTRNLELLKFFLSRGGKLNKNNPSIEIARRTQYRESCENEAEYNRFVEVANYLNSIMDE